MTTRMVVCALATLFVVGGLRPAAAITPQAANADVGSRGVGEAREGLPVTDRGGSVTLTRVKDDTQAPLPAIFLRGSFNQWGTDTALQSDGIGQWSAVLQLPAGRIEFKLGDSEWRRVELGGDADASATGPQWRTLRERGANLSFDAPQAGRYRFILRTGSTTAPPALRVEELR